MGSNFEERKNICYNFSSIMSVLWQICNTFEVNLKKNTQKVLKQSKQQFMYLISTKELLSGWVATLKREKPFVTVFLPSCRFCRRYAILSRLI